jgi:hypothetical protein
MPLSRLENFLKNAEGNILYVSPSDFDATDSFENQGNSLTRPFKTIQRALIEAARFSYQNGRNNDKIDRTTILVYPGTHYIDNRPGYSITASGANVTYKKRTGATTWTSTTLAEFGVNTNYDILDTNNDLYKFNSINGGVILPRGTSIIGYDLRKTKIRPLYVPNPEDTTVENSSIFNVTGTCYFSIFTFLDGDPTKTVFKDYTDNRFVPNFSHHKLVSFAYADGVNKVVLGGNEQTDLTDLDMYYYKVAKAYGDLTGRGVLDYPSNSDFEPSTDEYRIVGSLQANPIGISSIFGGNGITNPTNVITVTTKDFLTGEDKAHGLSIDSPVLISGITADGAAFNGSFTVKEVVGLTTFTYTSTAAPANATPAASSYESGIVTIESDTVSSASPYVFNCSIRSVYGLNGMWADGNKADGFKSMVVAQFTGVSLQKDDNAFLVYENGAYQSNATLDINSRQRPLHTNGNAIYKPDYESTHIRVSNNGFIQCVSIFAIGFSKHFVTESGGDMSITNSNSNFGAVSLESTGFRNESFDRDDVGYITHIIPPKEIENIESDVTWLSLDAAKTISVATTSNLYLYNYKSSSIKPTHQVDGYRIGARTNDNLNLTVVVGTAQTTYTSPILMSVPSGTGVSAKKSYTVTRTGTQNDIASNTFTLSASHQLYNGESVRVFSDTSQAPDGIELDTVYYTITTGSPTQIKLAYSLNDAIANQPITGINNNGGVLTIVSSVTDKLPGDLGHPIQFDTPQSQWYITGTATTATNQIYNSIVGIGTSILGNETASTFVKRKVDNRSIEDRVYKVRYVIPKEFDNARPPQGGFILQESKTVGVSTISFDNKYTLNSDTPPAYLRNEKIISNATVDGNQLVTATTELPHGFIVGDKVKIQKVKSTNNPLGTGLTSTYNGSYQVLSVPSTKQFTYQLSGVKINPGTYTNLINARSTRQERDQLPLVSREQYTGNYFIYRVNTIKNHIPGTGGQDGIYNLTVLASNVTPPTTVGYGISQKAFNQDIRNLYPQIDRDNFTADPLEAVSYADIKTLGKVVTGDKKKSITKEAINSFVRNTRIGFGITGISTSGIAGTTITVFTDVEHTLNSLKSVSITASGSGYGSTIIYASNVTGGTGTNASLRVNPNTDGSVFSVSIVDPGCVYIVNDVLTIPDTTTESKATVKVDEINNNVGDGIELSGFNQENLNGVYKILSVPSSKSFTIYNPAGVSGYTQNTNGRVPTAVLASKGVGITSFRFDSVSTGIVTVTTSPAHGLLPGNKFTIVGSGHTIYDNSFFVEENVGLNTFTFYVGIVTQTKESTAGTLLKGAISANALNLTRGEENLGSRASYIYAGITTALTTTIATIDTSIVLSSAAGFNRGDYVLINAEIIRLASAPSGNTFTVLRGRFSTYKTTAEVGTQVKKIKVLPMEVRRPSFLRASGHTFEYLGYGPGNYSTGMPQKQTRTLTEDDVLTSQAREQAGGTVVYSAMNDLGDFYSGTKKLSSATGEEKVIDAPIITFTGDDAQGENQNRSSGIFDDVLIKERITIEGGENGNQSSQFYGPVNFTKKVTNTSDEGINTNNLFIKGTASQGKLITVGISTPTTAEIPSPKDGDISLIQPPSGGYIGQAYVNNEWKKFGLVSSSADILDIKVDRLGIGNTSTFTNAGESIDSTVKLYVAGTSKFEDVTFLNAPTFANGVTLNNTNFAGLNINGTARFTGTGGTTYAIYVNDPVNLGSGSTAISRLYNLEVANNSYISGNLGIGTTNPSVKLDVIGSANISGNAKVNSLNINTTGIGEGDLGSNGGTDGVFGIYNTTNSGSIRLIAKNSSGAENSILNVTSGIATVNGALNATGSLTGGGFDFILGNTDQSTRGNSGLSRALVKDTGTILALNYAGDFTGGVRVDSRISVGGTITATTSNAATETRGTFVRLTNAGNGGDSVISWDNTYNNANQRWYAGIDVSDGASWKLAKPITADFDNENFDRATNTIDQTETKLKIDTSGTATFLGGLNAARTNNKNPVSSNTYNFTVATTGNTVIAGTLSASSNKFSVDTSGNVTAAGKITGSSLEITTGTATFGNTVSVEKSVTAESFIKSGATATNFLKAGGADAALTGAEVVTALGFTPANVASQTGSLPQGNSLICDPLTIDAFGNPTKFGNRNQIEFELKINGNAFTPAGSEAGAANLLVSLGGVIQKAGTDYKIVNTNRIQFLDNNKNAYTPAQGLDCFIVALGGQGSLISNIDWNKKGEILVAIADNAAIQLQVPESNGTAIDNYILTTDKSTSTGVAWKSTFAGNAATATIAASCSGNAGTATTAASCSGNASTVTNGFYTTSSFNLGTTSIAVNRVSGAQTLTGVSIDGNAGSVTNGFYANSSFNLGTTSIAVNRASGAQTLTGVSIDGNAATASNLTGTPNIKVGIVTATTVSGNGTIPVGGIIMWSGVARNRSNEYPTGIPPGWSLCNGQRDPVSGLTPPNLMDRFVVGAGAVYDAGATGGSNSVSLEVSNLPPHNHVFPGDDQLSNGANMYPGWGPDRNTETTFKYDATSSIENRWNAPFWKTTDTGSGTAFDIRPLYYALAYIMRTL